MKGMLNFSSDNYRHGSIDRIANEIVKDMNICLKYEKYLKLRTILLSLFLILLHR